MEQKTEKRGEEKPAGTWSSSRKARKTFCKKRFTKQTHRYTFLHTHSHSAETLWPKQVFSNTGKSKTNIHKKKTQYFCSTHTFRYTQSEAAANFDCGTEESQENLTGARKRRNVLKLGHSLREGGKKCLCRNVSLQGRI